MILDWSLSFNLSAYRPAVMRCLLVILFAVKIGDREILHLSYAIDTKRKTYELLNLKIASRGFSIEHINRPESRIVGFEPVGFRRAKRIKLVRESIYPAPA